MKTRSFEIVCDIRKRTSWVIALCLSLLLGGAPIVARSQEQSDIAPGSTLGGVVSSNLNPLQAALLHWYGANQTTSFTVGSSPFGIAFDGANMWIANFTTGKVTKVRANDGFTLETFTGGGGPTTLAYDWANMWVANSHTNKVTKLRGSDGTALGTFTVGTGPTGICFDGANMWVTNVQVNTVTKLRARDGKVLETFTVGGHNAAFLSTSRGRLVLTEHLDSVSTIISISSNVLWIFKSDFLAGSRDDHHPSLGRLRPV